MEEGGIGGRKRGRKIEGSELFKMKARRIYRSINKYRKRFVGLGLRVLWNVGFDYCIFLFLKVKKKNNFKIRFFKIG